MKYTDLVTQWINTLIPKCAVDLRINTTGIEYLHPTKGWRKRSFRRLPLAIRQVWLNQ